MAFILCYTKPGTGIYSGIPGEPYDASNYSGKERGYNCDVDHAMHLAVSKDGKAFTALRNNTGILFPKCTFTEGEPRGTTKTMLYPWIFRMADGSFGVSAVRRNRNAPDPLSVGCLMLFTSKDLVRYEEACFLKLSDGEIKHPRCRWDAQKDAYYVEWETAEGLFCGYTKYFKEIRDVKPCSSPTFEAASDYGIEGCVPGNVIEVTEEEEDVIRKHFDVIYNVGVAPSEMEVKAGEKPCFCSLPKATMLYSDGSTHDKPVKWDKDAFEKIDFSKPGVYEIPGEVSIKHWPFPMPLSPLPGLPPERQGGVSDPDVAYYHGKYYLTTLGPDGIFIRCADTLTDAFTAEAVKIHESSVKGMGHWAPELHIIKGVPYIFTALCPGYYNDCNSYVLRCNGDIMDPNAWDKPRLCVKPNGEILRVEGVSLDMTYLCVNGVHYVMWSDRHWIDITVEEPVITEPAGISIAVIDPDAPWQCVTEPQRILNPIYGWDRYGTEVDEGPFLLRHGDDLFVSVSGSSTANADLYCLGLLHAKAGNNLLTMEGWDWIPYPLLTKESVVGEYGPGHNSFVKDHETGDDMMVYHAVPHDENGKALGRKGAVRRVHWAATGLPYLEMTEERDSDPKFKNITLKITVKS